MVISPFCPLSIQLVAKQNEGVKVSYQEQFDKLPTISLDELRWFTDTKERYKSMTHFTRTILDCPCQEITKKNHLAVEYQKIKNGRTVNVVEFFVKSKVQAPLSSQPGKKAKEHDAKLQQSDSELFMAAMTSPYTKWLSEAMMLSTKDTTNPKLMIALQRDVYPQYDELAKLMGSQGQDKVHEHITYVAHHWAPKEDKRQSNKARYLDVSISRYLREVKMRMDLQNKETDDEEPF